MIGLIKKTIFFVILFIGAICDLFGQKIEAINPFPENNFASISVEQGLSQSTIYSILKDSRGFMWFGTRTGGLNKYNGYEFIVFKNDQKDVNSLANNEVVSLFEDHQGRIWIGTRNGGLNYYVPEQDVFFRLFLPGFENQTYTTTAIFQCNDNNIWIGTSKGLYSYNYENSTLDLILDSDITGSISAISVLSNRNVVVASTEKLLVYNVDTEYLSQYEFDNNLVDHAPGDKKTPLMVDIKDNIWVGSVEGLLTFSVDHELNLIKSRPFAFLPEPLKSDIRSIKSDQDGMIWFGTFLGLVKYDSGANSFVIFNKDENNPMSIKHNSIYSMFIDETNMLWVGTWGGGVNLMSGLLRKFEHFSSQINNPKSLSDNIVSSFAEGKRGIWVGTEQGGLNYFDPKLKTFKYFKIDKIGPNSNVSDHIKVLLYESDDKLWVGTFGNGLILLDLKSNSLKHFLDDKKIFSLAQTPDQNIWVGTLSGLFKLSPNGNLLDHYQHQSGIPNSLSDDLVSTMIVDENGDLWIGTKNGGLNLYNKHTNNFKRFTHNVNDKNSISSNYIFSLCNSESQTLWIGTLQGLNRLNILNGEISRISEDVNFPDQVINGILPDESKGLWLSTNKGVINYKYNENSYVKYDFSDGLQSNEFNRGSYFKASDGKLYFGGINGFNSFYPSHIEENPHVPQIQFTDFKLFYKSVKPNSPSSPLKQSISHTNEIVLSHSQSAFNIEFVALNYILPEKNQYAYYMEGVDLDWNYVGNKRSASYMNLEPGKYTFHVKASNNDNLWNEKGIGLNIVILPPFWKTPWAFLILGIILLLLLLLARAIIISRIKQQNQIEFQRREVKRIEELNNMKLRFFTDISHEFKTPLTLIASPVEKLYKYAQISDEFGYLISIAFKNVKRMMRLVDQLMTFRRIDQNSIKVSVSEYDMAQVLKEISDDFSELAVDRQIKLKFHSQNISSEKQWFDKAFLDKIVFNILSNAFKYTPKGGEISIYLTLENDYAHISINDTGVGIAPEKIHRIFDRFYTEDTHQNKSNSGAGVGLSLTKSLVEAHRGNISVESTLGKGSTFKVVLPIHRHFFSDSEIGFNEPLLQVEHLSKSNNHVPKIQMPVVSDSSSNEKIILVVEDNEDMRNYLLFHFKEYNSISAENGQEALVITQNIIPDLIISDVMMPIVDGIELLRKIRENHVTSHVPFILLSAKSEIVDKIEGVESGADIYIEKPFDLDYLKASVNNLLDLRKNLKELYSKNQLSNISNPNIPVLHKQFLEKAAALVLDNISNEKFSINELGDELGLSRSQLFRKFKIICDISPGEFIRNERLNFAYKQLLSGEFNVNEVAFKSGFSSSSYFITSFKKMFGKTPSEISKQP